MTESGFYKLDNGDLLYAPNAVYHRDWKLMRGGKYSSAGGWAWYDSREAACRALGIAYPPLREALAAEGIVDEEVVARVERAVAATHTTATSVEEATR